MSGSRKLEWAVLAILLAAIALSFMYTPQPMLQLNASTTSVKPNARDSAVEDQLPTLELLNRELPELSGIRRNVFQFGDGSFEIEPAEIPEITELEPGIQTALEGPDVTYLGFYRERDGDQKKAAISNGGQIYVGGPGEILAGKYKVLEVADEEIVIQLISDGSIIRLPLGRNGAPPPHD